MYLAIANYPLVAAVIYSSIFIYKAVARLFEAQCRSAALQLKTWKY